MKSKLFLLGWFMVCMTAFGQTETVGQLFKLKARTQVVFVSQMKSIPGVAPLTNASNVWIDENVIYKVATINHTTGQVTFYALDFNALESNENGYQGVSDMFYNYNDKLFQITLANYRIGTTDYKIPDRMNFGVLALPFKFRPQKSLSFSTEFNLNLTVGLKLTPSYYSAKIYLQGGAGTGTASLNSSNSTGIISGEEQNIMTITAFTGLMVQYNDLQLGLYVGTDWINNNKKYQWESQGKAWISLGVGFKVFTLIKKETN